MTDRSIDRIRTPLDYAREVLGRLPRQGVRLDILVAMTGLNRGEVAMMMTRKVDLAGLPPPVLVEGEFDWAI